MKSTSTRPASISLLLAFLFSTALPAQVRWERTYLDGTYSDEIARIAQTADGGFLAYVLSKETQTSSEFKFVARLASNGEMLDLDTSVQTYAGYPYPHLFPLADGRTRVIGFWEDGPDTLMTTAYFTPNFQHVWTGSPEVPFAGVPLMVDDTTFVAARRDDSGFKIMKLTLSGEVLWQNQYNASSTNLQQSYHNLDVDACADGGFFLSAMFGNYMGVAKFSADGALEMSKWAWINGGIASVRCAASPGGYYCLFGDQLRRLDFSGNTVWNKYVTSIIGNNAYVALDLALAADGSSVMLTGYNSQGQENYFLAKVTPAGSLAWSNSYGLNNKKENAFQLVRTPDKGFLMVGRRHEVASQFGPNDAYAVKVDSAGSNWSSIVRGKFFKDENDNCALDPAEPGYGGSKIRATYDQKEYYRLTDSTGSYAIPVGEGASTVEVSVAQTPYTEFCVGTSAQFNLGMLDTATYDFPSAFIDCPLMWVDLATAVMRPCSTSYYCIWYCNQGSGVAEDATLRLQLHEGLEFLNAPLAWTNPEPGVYEFFLGDLEPGYCSSFHVYFNVPCTDTIGQVHCSTVTAEPDTICIENPIFQSDPPYQERDCRAVTNSYDPNDKLWRAGTEDQIGLDSTLKYMIRFQNTGNDTAFNVVVRDTLSPFLDPLTIQPGSARHPFRWELGDFGVVSFIFENILLPDSTTNEPGSHGFVQFKIRQRPALARNAEIKNRAGIFFDFNPPVMTNTVNQQVDYPDHPRHDSLSLCAGETFNSQPQFADTTFVQTLLFPAFDSVVYTHLTVLPVFESTLDTLVPLGSVVSGLPVFFEENYTATLIAANGCDSTVHVHAVPVPGSGANLAAGDLEVCQFQTASYSLPFHPEATYLWSSHGGLIQSGQGTSEVAIFWQNPPEGDVGAFVAIGSDTVEVEAVPVVIFPYELTVQGAAADPLCFGGSDGSIDLSAFGAGEPLTFAWSSGAATEDLAGLPAGAYSVTVTNAFGCTSALEFSLAEPPALAADFLLENPAAGQSNGSIAATPGGGTPPYLLAWSGGQTGESLSGLSAGAYSVTITDAHDCTLTGELTLEDLPLAASDLVKKFGLALSPNPVGREALRVVFKLPEAQPVRLEVLDALGRRVAVLLDGEVLAGGEHRLEVPVGEWSQGIYLLRFEGAALKFFKK